MFNKVLSTRVFLDRLKYSEIKPLFKGGDKTGIFLLTSFYKIVENILYKRLYNHINHIII